MVCCPHEFAAKDAPSESQVVKRGRQSEVAMSIHFSIGQSSDSNQTESGATETFLNKFSGEHTIQQTREDTSSSNEAGFVLILALARLKDVP